MMSCGMRPANVLAIRDDLYPIWEFRSNWKLVISTTDMCLIDITKCRRSSFSSRPHHSSCVGNQVCV